MSILKAKSTWNLGQHLGLYVEDDDDIIAALAAYEAKKKAKKEKRKGKLKKNGYGKEKGKAKNGCVSSVPK